MNTRIAGALFGVLFTTAAAHAQTVIVLPAPSADALEPATMPDYCAERDVNCVLDDGLLPRRAAVGAALSAIPGAAMPAPQPAAGTTASGMAQPAPATAIAPHHSGDLAGRR
jgi:hypothetical protein